jgi:hypothetical protein
MKFRLGQVFARTGIVVEVFFFLAPAPLVAVADTTCIVIASKFL